MAVRIYCKDTTDQPLELYGDESIQLDINVNDIYDIGKVFTSISKTFKVPATKNNNKIFKHYYNVNLDGTFNAYQKFGVVLEVDSVPLIDGYLQLLNVDVENNEPKSYEVLVASEVANLLRDIGEDKMVDLPLELDHIFNLTNITGSWGGSIGSGAVRYCIADQAAKSTTVPLQWQSSGTPIIEEDFLPTVSCKKIIDTIFSRYGYTYSSDFITDTSGNFANLHLLLNPPGDAENFNDKLFQALNSSNFTVTSGITAAAFNSEVYDNGSNYNNATYTYTVPIGGLYQFSFNGQIRNNDASINGVIVSLNVNGASTATLPSSQFLTIGASQTVNYGGIFIQPLNLNSGDLVTLSVVTQIPTASLTLLAGATFTCESGPVTPIGTTISPEDLMPDMKVKDFIAGIGRVFNWVFLPDPNTPKNIIIEPRPQWLLDGQVRDWRTYWMQDRTLTIKPTTEVQKRTIKFTFETGDAYIEEQYEKLYGYGHGSQVLLDTGNEFASDELEVSVPFTCSLVAGVAGDTNLQIPYLFKEDGKPSDIGMRLLYWNGTRNCAGVWIKNSQANTVASYIAVPAMHPYNDDALGSSTFCCSFAPPEVPFGNVPTKNAFTEYWAQYIGELYGDDARIVEASFNVAPHIIYNLGLNDTIYFLDDYWRINTISYDTTTEIAQMQLYRADFYTNNICTADSVQVQSDGTVRFFSQGVVQAATERCCNYYRYFWNRGDGACYWRTRKTATSKNTALNSLQSWGSISGTIANQRDLADLPIDGGSSEE